MSQVKAVGKLSRVICRRWNNMPRVNMLKWLCQLVLITSALKFTLLKTLKLWSRWVQRHYTNAVQLWTNVFDHACMARMEIDYNLNVSTFCCCIMQKSLKNLLWFAFVTKNHLISSSWRSTRILCVSTRYLTITLGRLWQNARRSSAI